MALPRFRRPRFLIALAATVLLTAASAGLYFVERPVTPRQLAFSEFIQRVESGGVTAVTFGERDILVTFRDGATATTVAPPEFSRNSSFITDLVRREVRVEVTPASDPTSLSWSALTVAAAFFALLGFTVYRTTAGKIPSIGSRTRLADRSDERGHVPGRGRRGRGQRRGQGNRRLPARAGPILSGRRAYSEGHSAGRPSRVPEKRCWHARSRAKPACRSCSRAAPTSSRCMPASAPRACASCFATRSVTAPASSSSTSSMRSAAAAAATR